MVARGRVLMLRTAQSFVQHGGPGQSPTADLRVRSALLYATELPGHVMKEGIAIGP